MHSRGKRQHKSVKNCTHIHTRAREMRERESLLTAMKRQDFRHPFWSYDNTFFLFLLSFLKILMDWRAGRRKKNKTKHKKSITTHKRVSEWVEVTPPRLPPKHLSSTKRKKKSLWEEEEEEEEEEIWNKTENPKLAVARCSLACSHCLHSYHKTHKTKRLFSNKVYFSSLRAFSSLPESSLFCPSFFLCVAVFVGVFSFPAAAAAVMSTRLNLGMMTQ